MTEDLPLGRAAQHFRAMSEKDLASLVLIADHGPARVRLTRLDSGHDRDQAVRHRDQDPSIGLILAFGEVVVISGSSGLADFRRRPYDLDSLVQAAFMLGTDAKSRRSHQMRLSGRLERSLACLGGRWTTLEADDSDYCVIGGDEERRRLYAIRRTADGTRMHLCYATLSCVDRPIHWNHVARLPERCSEILDASRFTSIRPLKAMGAIIHLLGADGHPQNRLLTLMEGADGPVAQWSAPFDGTFRVLREDKRGTLTDPTGRCRATGLLLEEESEDGMILRRLPMQRCVEQQLYAYLISFLG